MKKFDDASWHTGGTFPPELSYADACTHIGMFLAWVIHRGLLGDTPARAATESVLSRTLTGRDALIQYCDGKLTNEDLCPEGNSFCMSYYETGDYFQDLDSLFGNEVSTLYHIKDSWDNFDKIAACIDKRFKEWTDRKSP